MTEHISDHNTYVLIKFPWEGIKLNITHLDVKQKDSPKGIDFIICELVAIHIIGMLIVLNLLEHILK